MTNPKVVVRLWPAEASALLHVLKGEAVPPGNEGLFRNGVELLETALRNLVEKRNEG